MPPKKRGGSDRRRSSNENKRSCFAAGNATESGNLDTKQGVCRELSEDVAFYVSKNVVSLTLSDGNKVLFASSGIAIYHMDHVAKFLTSGSLVRALDNEAKYCSNIKIQVHLEGNAVTGCLDEYDLDYNTAVVKITSFLDVREVFLHHAEKFALDCDVVAIGRDICGKRMSINGKLTHNPARSQDSECLMFSTCKLSEAFDGGALYDFHGNFVGMNLFSRMGISLFMPVSLIKERVEYFRSSQQRTVFLDWVQDLNSSRVAKRDVCSHTGAHGHTMHSDLGFPGPAISCFGDVYPSGVWGQFHKRVSRKISQTVVSLASFNGDTMFFACTGSFIDWDKCQDESVSTILTSATLVRNSDPSVLGNEIIDCLRIEVLLPEGQLIEGTLLHYNLHYNVAVVSVKNYVAASSAILKHKKMSSEVVAVGRCFKSGNLMASRGKLVGWSGSLDCNVLQYSTCKITKAGIGGPLVDSDGYFIGMNFYDPKMGTPALLCDNILSIIKGFKETGNNSHGCTYDDTGRMNRWPVSGRKALCSYERGVLASGRKYGYCAGFITLLK